MREYASPLAALDLHSFRNLTAILGVPRDELRNLVAQVGTYYEPFSKREKPRPFAHDVKPHKNRVIDNPTGSLKLIQSRIETRLLKRLILPDHLLGGVRGKTIRDNASIHFSARYVVTVDIKGFFPSITPLQVYAIWSEVLNCSPKIAETLTKLTTYRGHLPQGAPTSTLLANLVLAHADLPIREACDAMQVRYSSWVDDLTFSGENARDVTPEVIKILRESGFAVAHRKIKVMGPGERKTVNGLVLGRFITVERRYIRKIRAGIHNLSVGKVPPSQTARYVLSLEGQINYVGLYDAKKASSLRIALQETQEPGALGSRRSIGR